MGINGLNFKRVNRARPRAALHIRLARMIKRKRVAMTRLEAEANRLRYVRSLREMARVAAKLDVPIDPLQPVPTPPELPGRAWVEFKQGMTDLKPAVKPETAQAEPQPALATT